MGLTCGQVGSGGCWASALHSLQLASHGLPASLASLLSQHAWLACLACPHRHQLAGDVVDALHAAAHRQVEAMVVLRRLQPGRGQSVTRAACSTASPTTLEL